MDQRHTTSLLVLLCFTAGSSGFALDVCASCHVNATCHNKPNQSGKVCTCKYGLVGNGLSLCQDKDECQLGAMLMCGPHTTCHNTFGSYYCTCLQGYSPSNNMNVFIPNDGTHCQDVDECSVPGVCGRGALCRNLEASVECSCQPGYTVYNGPEPFHPQRDSSTCREVSCGPPIMPYNATLWSATGTTYGQVVTLVCEDGFVWRGGDNTSVCGADGLWTMPTIVCEGVDCGSPPTLPHTHMLWDQRSRLHSKVYYQCDSGYDITGGSNVSTCGAAGLWEGADLFCREIDCGIAPVMESADRLWTGQSVPGSSAEYLCKDGFRSTGGQNQSVCGLDGQWTRPTLSCQAKCGPVPVLAHSEVIWQNTSVAIHRCVSGFHSRRGHNASVCSSYGVWHRATLRCVEVQPAITHVSLAEEKCLRWRAEKYEDDTEVYKVTYFGSRDFDLTFRDSGKQFLRSKSSHVEVCLNLFPVTNYTIYISAVSASFTVSITSNTSLTVPPAPTVYYTEHETTVPTLSLRRTPNSLDSISVYEVFVLPGDDLMEFNCSALGPNSSSESSAEYITALIHVSRVETEMNFTVGDRLLYGGVWNTPLANGRSYYVLLRVVSRWKTATTSSCVLWAKVKGTWNFLTLTSLCAAASILLVVLVALGVYACLRRRR